MIFQVILIIITLLAGTFFLFLGIIIEESGLKILGSVIIIVSFVICFTNSPKDPIPEPITKQIDKGYYYHLEQDSEVIAYPDTLFTISHR